MWEWLGPLITGGKIVKNEFDLRSQEKKQALALYRSLEQNLTELDYYVRILAGFQIKAFFGPDSAFLISAMNGVRSALKPVSEARPKLAELGDTAILDQLNTVCRLLDLCLEIVGNYTGFISAVFAAKAVLDPHFEILQTLRNHVAWKVQSLAGR